MCERRADEAKGQPLAGAARAATEGVNPRAEAAGGFEAFYRREFPAALHLAWSLTGQHAVAEEVCQEAFLAAHRRWAKVANYDAPELWLRRVVTNRCVSVFRRRATEIRYLRRRSSSRPVDEAHLDPELPDDDVWAAVRALPRRQAQVVALMFVGDLSANEAAKAMRCSVDTVRTHLHRALAALEQRLTPDSTDPSTDRNESEQGGHDGH